MFPSKYKFKAHIAAALMSVLGASSAFAEVTELNLLGPDRSFPRVYKAFTDMDARFVRRAIPRTVEQMQRIQIGNSKEQLVGVVGRPVSRYDDGSWNYNVSFRLPQGHRLICQYRVYFDEAERVQGTIWRRPQCHDIIHQKNG